MRYLLVFWLVFMGLYRAGAQVERVPVQYAQFFNGYSLLNPASCGVTGDIELQFGQQRSSGAWRQNYTSFTSAVLRLRTNKRSNNFHAPGLFFMADVEGQYIKQSRGFISYAWHTKLTQNLSVSAGAAGGVYSFLVNAPSANAAGMASTGDGVIGLWLYNKKFHLGASLNQIFNSKIIPIVEESRLIPHFNFSGSFVYEVSRDMSITPIALIRALPGRNIDLDVGINATLNQALDIGINFRHQRNLSFFLGFHQMKLSRGNMRVGFSYAVPAESISLGYHSSELTVNYWLDRGKKRRK